LKQPISRISYLLELEGVLTPADHAGGNASKQAPPALLEEVFALNEELDEVRDLKASGAPKPNGARPQRAARPIDDKRQEHERQLQELGEVDAVIDGNPATAAPCSTRCASACSRELHQQPAGWN
jgi:hypothetical protein